MCVVDPPIGSYY